MNSQLPNPSKPMLYTGLVFLIGLAVAVLSYFLQSVIELIQAFRSLPEIISFDKGAFYMPGVFIGLAVLIFAAVYESVLRKKLSNKIASACTRTGVAAVLIIFVLPMVVHSSVENYLLQKNYSICSEASHQWLHSRTIVFVSSQNVCKSLEKNHK
jgi:hypothetical protein